MINMVGNSNFSESTGGSSFPNHPWRYRRAARDSNLLKAYVKKSAGRFSIILKYQRRHLNWLSNYFLFLGDNVIFVRSTFVLILMTRIKYTGYGNLKTGLLLVCTNYK